MTALSAARQLDEAVQRARSAATRLGEGTPTDVARWNTADLDAAKAADARAYLASPEAHRTAGDVLHQYVARDDTVVGTFQVRESIRNARTGVSEIVTHDFPMHIERLDGLTTTRASTPIAHVSFEELLALQDVDHANRALSKLASLMPSPELHPHRRALHASFVQLLPRESLRDGVDAYAGRGLLYIKDRTGQHVLLPAGRPIDERWLPKRPVPGDRDPNSATVERITRSSPILANVHDRHGETTDLWRASSVVLDTRAAARSIEPAGRR